MQAGGWTLATAADSDFDRLMSWFPDEDSVNIWGGPKFRYPFTGDTFREDCRIEIMTSYVLRNSDGVMAAFGQSCEREGRGHLARLVASPALRGQGAGRKLIQSIIGALEVAHDYDEYSLFVYRHNTPAYQCYLSLGFVVTDYPDDAPMRDRCYFLTRKATRRKQ